MDRVKEPSPFPDAEVTQGGGGGQTSGTGGAPKSSAAPPNFRDRRGAPPSADAEERERMPSTETVRTGGAGG